MDAQEYTDMDRDSLWHPYTKHSVAAAPMPIIREGRGVYLYDVEGRRYLDAISSWWCCNLGHGHPRLVEAIRRQAGELQHSILGSMSHPRAIELAGRLVRLFPDPDRRVFFGSDGASAVEAAHKIAVQYWANVGRPERCRFASLGDAYHGDTLGAVSVGYLDAFHRPFRPLLFPVHRANPPCCAACAYGKQPETCGERCFESMQRIIERHGRELAAVIVEPLCQGAAGMRIYSAGYLRKLAALCREREVLLIADEIAVGFGRTGRMFAFELAGIDPDIVCLGKGLSAGYLPISATVVRRRVFDTFADAPADHTFYHGHTFAGNPIAAAAAVETLRICEEEGVLARAAGAGAVLAAAMATLAGRAGVTHVRCLGMIGAFDLEGEAGAAAERAQRIRARMRDQGVLIRPLGNVIYLMLPLVTPGDVIADTVERLAEAAHTEGARCSAP